MFCFILEVDECLVHVILRNTQLKVVNKWQYIINNLAVLILLNSLEVSRRVPLNY